MKKGDVVTIRDGSYTRSVIGGKLIHEFLAYGKEVGRLYAVIEVGCVFPSNDSSDSARPLSSFNNTVIQAIDSGKVVFVEDCMLRLKYSMPKPIHEVTMAEVCAQFGQEVKIRKD